MTKNGIYSCICHFFVVPLHSQRNLQDKRKTLRNIEK